MNQSSRDLLKDTLLRDKERERRAVFEPVTSSTYGLFSTAGLEPMPLFNDFRNGVSIKEIDEC